MRKVLQLGTIVACAAALVIVASRGWWLYTDAERMKESITTLERAAGSPWDYRTELLDQSWYNVSGTLLREQRCPDRVALVAVREQCIRCGSVVDRLVRRMVGPAALACGETWIVAVDGNEDVLDAMRPVLEASGQSYRLLIPSNPPLFATKNQLTSTPMVLLVARDGWILGMAFGSPGNADIAALRELWNAGAATWTMRERPLIVMGAPDVPPVASAPPPRTDRSVER